VLKTLQKFEDFQAEYEGSIPFTRSSPLKDLIVSDVTLTSGLLCAFLCFPIDRFAPLLAFFGFRVRLRWRGREIFSELAKGFRHLVRLSS
jgi:hypothetical protein